MKWYLKALKQYVDFSGRARRMEYWMFVLFNSIASIIAFVLDLTIGSFGVIMGIYYLAVIIPTIAVTVRRLHDNGKSGWMYFIFLVPIIGVFWLLILLFREGQKGENQYGPDPKAI